MGMLERDNFLGPETNLTMKTHTLCIPLFCLLMWGGGMVWGQFSITSITAVNPSSQPGNGDFCAGTEIDIVGQGFDDPINYTYEVEIDGDPHSFTRIAPTIFRCRIDETLSGNKQNVTVIRTHKTNNTPPDGVTKKIDIVGLVEVSYPVTEFCSDPNASIVPSYNGGGAGDVTFTCNQCQFVSLQTNGPGNGTLTPAQVNGTSSYTVQVSYTQVGCAENTETFNLTQRPSPGISEFYYTLPGSSTQVNKFCRTMDPNPVVNASPLGQSYNFQAAPGNPSSVGKTLFLNNSNGVFALNSSDPGTYEVTFNPDPDFCKTPFSQTITIHDPDQVQVDYVQSVYCKNDANPIAMVNSPSGGQFEVPTGSGIVFADLTTGEIDITQSLNSGLGPQFDWAYRTSGDCPVLVGGTVSIHEVTAGFSLPDSVCLAGGDILATGIQGPGEFSVQGPNNFSLSGIDNDDRDIIFASQLDLFDPLNSGTGVYTVTYDMDYDQGSCTDVYQETIKVVAPEVPTFGYGGGPFCTVDNTLYSPNLSSTNPSFSPVGYQSLPAAGIALNASTGVIDPFSSILPGTYTIQLDYLSNGCPKTISDTVTIQLPQPTLLNYTGQTAINGRISLCGNGQVVVPDAGIGVTGTYSWQASHSGQLHLNSNTGNIDPGQSDPGSYTVTFVPGISFCKQTAALTVEIIDLNASIVYPQWEYCEGDLQLPVPNSLGFNPDSIVYFLDPVLSTGVLTNNQMDPATGRFNINLVPSGDYYVKCSLQYQGCSTVLTAANPVVVKKPAQLSFVLDSVDICGLYPDNIGFTAAPGDPGSVVSYISSSSDFSIDSLTSMISYTGGGSPGTHTFEYSYESNGCPGTSTATLELDAPSSYSFDYGNALGPAILCENGGSTSPQLSLSIPGTFSYTSFQPGGTLDLSMSGVINPQNSNRGTYEVTFIPDPGLCYEPDSVEVSIEGIDFFFTYGAGGHCTNGGAFFPTTSSTSGLATTYWIDGVTNGISSTGLVAPSQLGAGVFLVHCQVEGASCQDTMASSDSLRIIAPEQPFISYDTSLFCQSLGEVSPDSITHSGGTWSTNLPYSIIDNAGKVDLTSFISQTTFEVFYEIQSPCNATGSFSMTVEIDEDMAFSYDKTVYCSEDLNISPTILGTQGGTFISDPPIGTALANNGTIDLDGDTLGMIPDDTEFTFEVTRYSFGYCPDTASYELTVAGAADASFAYDADRYCDDTDSIEVKTGSVVNPGGTYKWDDGTYVGLDTGSGTVTVGELLPGEYTVEYTVESNGCPGISEDKFEIVKYDSTFSMVLSEDTVCTSDTVWVDINLNGRPGNSDSEPAGFNIRQYMDTDTFYLLGENQGLGAGEEVNYEVSYQLTGVCGEEAQESLLLIAPVEAELMYDTYHCTNEPNFFPTIVSPGGGRYWMVDQNGAILNDDSQIDTLWGEVKLEALHGEGQRELTVVYQTEGRCPDMAEVEIFLFDSVDFKIDSGRTEYCWLELPEPVSTDAMFPDRITYSLFDSHGKQIRISNGTEFVFDPADTLYNGAYLEVAIVDNEYCTMTRRQTYAIYTKPILTPLKDKYINEPEQEIALNLESNIPGVSVEYYWSDTLGTILSEGDILFPGIVDSIASFLTVPDRSLNRESDSLFLELQSIFGTCSSEVVTVLFLLNPETDEIFIPEVFTPNGDNFNDTWQVQWIDAIKPEEYRIEVYNRAHGLVYDMRKLHPNWDGGLLPDGVYWWRLFHREQPIEAGGVTIRR